MATAKDLHVAHVARAAARLALIALVSVVGVNAYAHDGVCRPGDASEAARGALQRQPGDLNARIALADALLGESCHDEAVRVLAEGEAMHPRNLALQTRLREARSMQSEQQYFEGLERAEAAARLSRNLLRCNRLADLAACDAALALQPQDPNIVSAKADALLSAGKPAEALRLYERALQLEPSNAALQAKAASARARRQELVAACESGVGNQALQACHAAWLPGAPDEFLVHWRKGVLLQAANQPAAALDAYVAAQLLRPQDRAVSLAIVSLSESTGRNDALTLAARGAALLHLERPAEALAALRQAESLSPGLPRLKAQLAQAERLARAPAQIARRIADATPAAAPVATPEPAPARYSNAAPETRSH